MTEPYIEAQRICDAKGLRFNEVFLRQYFLTESGGLCPEGWKLRKLGSWYLYHCPNLAVHDLKDSGGKKVGLFLGVGIGSDGEVYPGTDSLAQKAGTAQFWDATTREIEGIAGRYLAIVAVKQEVRVYHDPVCDLAAVYDPVCRVVASSLLLGLHRPLQKNRRMNHLGPLRQQHNFALQQTADRFARRAMANHYLDLRNFCQVRHFPHGDEEFATTEGDLQDTMGQIVARLRQIMTALLQNHDCVIPVTGGNDSRNVIACCGPQLKHVKSFFTHHYNKTSGFDCMIAQQIGETLGIEVETIDVTSGANKHLLDKNAMHRKRWALAYATGYSWRGTEPETVAGTELVTKGDILIRGNVMELMRANQYLPGNWYEFSLEHALGKLRVAPRIDDTQVAIWGPEYMQWVDTLPKNARNRIYDFAFAELLLPNTMGGMLIAPAPQFYMNAFSDRRMMSLAMAMDPKVRRKNKMNRMLVEMACPELNKIPRTNEFKKKAENHQAYDRLYRSVV